MRIGMLTQWFDPEPGGGAVPGVLARGLAARGHAMRVLTGYPNYPTGTIYPGYRQRVRHVETPWPSVNVRRVPLIPSHDGRATMRAGNYLSFACSAATVGRAWLAQCDAMWVYNSPTTVSSAARHLSRRSGVPMLLHIMDVWPDSVLESGILRTGTVRRWAERLLTDVVRRAYEASSAIAVTSPGQLDLLNARGVPTEKLKYIPVWADESIFHPQPSDRSLLPEAVRQAPLIVMYAGALGYLQGLDHAIRAASDARDSGVQLVLIGSGVAAKPLEELAEELRAPNIHFLGRKDPAQMGVLTAAADIHLVSLADSPLLRVTMPSKIQTIMASGKPIIACCAGDAAAAVREAGAGVVVQQGNVAELADLFKTLASDTTGQAIAWAESSRQYYEATFAQARAIQRVESLLTAIAR